MIVIPPHWTLGIDPAINGAAILLAPEGDAVVGWSWRTRTENKKRVWEVAVVQPPFFRLERHKTIYGISLLIKAGCERVIEGDPLWVGCEAPHIGLDPSAGLSVAMTTGKMIGPLEEKADHGIILILPGEWRSQILGLKRTTKRDDAKVISLSEIPKYVEGLSEILSTTARIFDCEIDKLDHVTDAAGVALSATREATLSAQEGRDGHTKKRKRRTPKPDPSPASAPGDSPATSKKRRSRKADRG